MALRDQIRDLWPDLSAEGTEKALQFYKLLLMENEKQNLTRLTSEEDFLCGHLLDVCELVRSGFVQFPAVDLGSGGGVPGLLAAATAPGDWILVESEKQKAGFLERTAAEQGLTDRVQVFGERFEAVAKHVRPQTIVARAVGKIAKVFPWVEPCSTWNNVVLFKGPGWEEEWAEFQLTKFRNRLEIEGVHRYTSGTENKQRVIVNLVRVPRGTRG
jgi:16S rRNA (guanine527-N7)-methyltransferase